MNQLDLNEFEKNKLTETLFMIDPSSLSYDEWFSVSAACCHEGIDFSAWDVWCAQDSARYNAKENEKHWKSIENRENGTKSGAGTIYHYARESKTAGSPSHRPISTLYKGSPREHQTKEFPPYKGLTPAEQAIEQLNLLFDDEEKVDIVAASSWNDEKEKYGPEPSGHITAKKGDLVKSLKTAISKGEEDPMQAVFGEIGYNPEAGIWLRINPVDGKGIADENMTEYRNILVEGDESPIDEQLAAIRGLHLPYQCITYSGGKSIHAVMLVSAVTIDEYHAKFDYVYKKLNEHGFTIDPACKNPSRLSRLAGAKRGDQVQTLIEGRGGKQNFLAWKEWIEHYDQDPSSAQFVDLIQNLPQPDKIPDRNPELIQGVLRIGHKMYLSGPSKAGKSYALIELAVALATGRQWMGLPCTKGKVLYINFEIDGNSFTNRIEEVRKSLNIKEDIYQNLNYVTLRGKPHISQVESLTETLINEIPKGFYEAIILDPIYKMGIENENDNSEVAKFLGHIDQILEATGAAVIYCHHHSKGFQGGKSAMDRASGAGAFARDADAILDLIELDPSTAERPLDWYEELETTKQTAWQLSFGGSREFSPRDPINIFYQWPLHKVDEEGLLDDAEPMEKAMHKKGGETTKQKAIYTNKLKANQLKFYLMKHGTPWPRGEEGDKCIKLSDYMSTYPEEPQGPSAYRTRFSNNENLYPEFSIKQYKNITYIVQEKPTDDSS